MISRLSKNEKEIVKNIKEDYFSKKQKYGMLAKNSRLKIIHTFTDRKGEFDKPATLSVSKANTYIEKIKEHLDYIESKTKYLYIKSADKTKEIKKDLEDYATLQRITAGLDDFVQEKEHKKSIVPTAFGIDTSRIKEDFQGIIEKYGPPELKEIKDDKDVESRLQNTEEAVEATNELLTNEIARNDREKAEEVKDKLQTYKKKDNTEVNKELLGVNVDIRDTLDKIHTDLIDEQDTSIKNLGGPGTQKVSAMYGDGTEETDDEQEESDSSFFGMFPLGKLKGKFGKFGKGRKAKKVSKKIGKKVAKKGVKRASKKMLGRLGRGALRGLGRAARFLGPIGALAAVGMSVYDGFQGWKNSSDILDMKDGEEATGVNKASAATGSIISGLTFGLVDEKETSKGLNNLLGGNKAIEKYEAAGIIDHDMIGKSDIEDWEKLAKLKPQEIQDIIDIDDWSEEDLAKMLAIKEAATLREVEQNVQKAPQAQEVNKITADVEEVKAKEVKKEKEEQKPQYKKVTYKMSSLLSMDHMIQDKETGQWTHSTNPDDYKLKEIFNFGSSSDLDMTGLDPNLLSNLKAMGAEYYDMFGKKMQINSAFRSIQKQAELYDKLPPGKAAKPGRSMHNYGLAFDMQSTDAEAAIGAGLFQKYGFKRPIPKETWHVEPVGLNRDKIKAEGEEAFKAARTPIVDKGAASPEKPKEDVETSKSTEQKLDTAQKTADVKKVPAKKVSEAIKEQKEATGYEYENYPWDDKGEIVKNYRYNEADIPLTQKQLDYLTNLMNGSDSKKQFGVLIMEDLAKGKGPKKEVPAKKAESNVEIVHNGETLLVSQEQADKWRYMTATGKKHLADLQMTAYAKQQKEAKKVSTATKTKEDDLVEMEVQGKKVKVTQVQFKELKELKESGKEEEYNKKAEELAKADTEAKKAPKDNATAESNKEQKEEYVQEQSKALVQNTKSYDTKQKSSEPQHTQIDINNTAPAQQQDDSRILNSFPKEA